MYPSRLIRKKFLEYFKKNNHEIINSSSLIPENDPTLLFTNAGMVQFKNILTGDEESRLKKVATSQKCIRAGGKHNDLENVGYTLRHHTFFEMLGNFSFGDYFKEEAIFYAWDLLINEYKIDKKKLLITVFSEDSITKNIWRKITGLSSDKIISVNSKDNFWSMGDTGPCGPCTEIFYDYGDKISGSISNKGISGDRFVEIFPDGVVRGCEVKKLWNISKIGNVKESNFNIVDIIKSKNAKNFRKVAKKCTCTFECASAINTVYDPKHWVSLI